MKQVWRYIKNTLNEIKRFSEHESSTTKLESKRNGLGHFVLLLSLTPFIFSLTLFDLHTFSDVASKYQFDPDRFDGLSYEMLISNSLKKPKKPTLKISKKDKNFIKSLTKKSPEALCNLNVPTNKPLVFRFDLLMRVKLNKQCNRYKSEYRAYRVKLSVYNATLKTNKGEEIRLNQQADSFIRNAHLKPPVPDIDIIETSSRQFERLLKQLSLDNNMMMHDANEISLGHEYPLNLIDEEPTNLVEVEEEIPDLESIDTNFGIWQTLIDKLVSTTSFQLIGVMPWLIAFFLIIPSVVYCIRQSAWGLLIFGIAAPSTYYVYYLVSLCLGAGTSSIMEFIPLVFAQIAFIWFLVTGAIFSRAFLIFILLLLLSTFLPLLLGSLRVFEWTYLNQDGYFVSQAQIPILIFIIIAAAGRLLVKGAKENFALLIRLGAIRNLKSTGHAFLLWLPMAALCLPFFYLSKVLIPTEVTNTLHAGKILRYDHTHPQGFLDNALRSLAHITDDVNFAWHLVIEERKAQLYASNEALQKIRFEETFSKHYNKVVPKKLVFEGPNSGVPIVGFLVDISTKETQKSINDTYTKFRGKVKDELSHLIVEKEQIIKEKAKDGKDAVIEEFEYIKDEGKTIILLQNSATQDGVWWTVNYLQATQQLALLLFFFICVKSYFYVFSRVVFHKDEGATVTLGDSKKTGSSASHLPDLQVALSPIDDSSIISTGIDYTIDTTKHDTYYITRRYQCRGKPPKLSIPQMFRSPLARIFSKTYTMNKVEVKNDDDHITCTATKGVEFFEWTLKAGETVIFDYDNFVGMTEELRLSTLISPRISSLLLGRMIYSQATGPGKLVLMARGRAQICNTNEKVGSMPPERIIAMHLDTILQVDSELDILNIYLSTAYVTPVAGKMIVDVDNQLGSKSGLARFVRNFLMPG